MRACVGILAAVVLALLGEVWGQTGPTHCSYSDGVYECDYTRMTSVSDRPISFSDFSVQPQQIQLTVDGFLPYFGDASVFDSGFSTSSSMDVTQFDSNYPASLEINCGWSGSAYIDTGAFSDMEYVQYFKVKNCDIFYIGADTFEFFESLDTFVIESGTIDTVEALSMDGLTVEKLSSATHQFPRLHGKFEVLNAKFNFGVISTGLLTYFTNVSYIAIKSAGLTNLAPDTFKDNQYVRIIDLSDNLFQEFRSGLFDNQNGLGELIVHNIEWECECDSLWWVQSLAQLNISTYGDMMCNNVQGTSLKKYYNLNCVISDPCDGKKGIAMGDKCQSVLGIVAMCLAMMSGVIVCIALVVAIFNWRDGHDSDDKDPVVLERLRRKARARWRKAARHIIYNMRKGKTLIGSEASRTMSIPDETKSHNRSSRFNSLRSSSCSGSFEGSLNFDYRHSRDYSEYSEYSSPGDYDYAAFPSSNQNRGHIGRKYR